VFRFDDQMLVTPHLVSNLVGHDSPMLHPRRMQDDGLFDRFAAHVDALWAPGRPACHRGTSAAIASSRRVPVS
jgi:hypothetical protein